MNPSKVYWDSSTYLDYLAGDHDLHDVMELLMEDWRKGLVTLVTSALTIAEVLFVRVRAGGPADRSRDSDIDALFDPPTPRKLLIVELSRLTAYRARDLARTGIGPRDAVHIASALEARCSVMHTTDKPLCSRTGTVGGSPPLKIEAPGWTRQLEAFTTPAATEPQQPAEQSPTDAQD